MDESELQQHIDTYNANLDNLPESLKGLIGNERVNIYIAVNGDEIVYGAVTKDAKITEYKEGGIEKPTIKVYTTDKTIRKIINSSNPVSAVTKAIKSKEIKYKGVGFFKKFKTGFMKLGFGIYTFFVREKPDADGDGITDNEDDCPYEFGTADNNGCPSVSCGNGVIEGSEQCDDGNLAGGDCCTAQCMLEPGCPGADSDGDGITDDIDACPMEYGVPENNGCPVSADSDGDGITDDIDACPMAYGTPENNGCPAADSDGDGVNDDADACPMQAGPADNNGCPVVSDQDGDGIADDVDACPMEYGIPENNGCPSVSCGNGVIEGGEQCDDGNLAGGDCCTAQCMIEPGCPGADSDGDGITDDIDACPMEYGAPENNGCPSVICDDANLSIEGAVINSGSRNVKLFIRNDADADLPISAYFTIFAQVYAYFSNARANSVTEVTVPESNILPYATPWESIDDIAEITVSSPDCPGISDTVQKSWITQKSQYCRYADASIEDARYDDMGELVLSVNNSGDADLGFSVSLQYVHIPVPYMWFFIVNANTAADFTMSEAYRDFNDAGEIYEATVTGVECSIGEYSFGRADIAANFLKGAITTNTNQENQVINVALTQADNAANTFQADIVLDSGGQVKDFVFDTGFYISPAKWYNITYSWVAGNKVIITDSVVQGVDIIDAPASLGDGSMNTQTEISFLFSPKYSP
ncbi:thrombospondin type 3 repeat-containing protein [Candidatus Woesearchaeota archaeon]|nr:thrombospondin type 3 repeat-containing protein [Candidatus Woesearchaeota archaeon]